uniref:Uncharacterized protein n=1 Tax=Oryza nivara TaxID=4536 RepID=A0A0E0GY02_ORYNI
MAACSFRRDEARPHRRTAWRRSEAARQPKRGTASPPTGWSGPRGDEQQVRRRPAARRKMAATPCGAAEDGGGDDAIVDGGGAALELRCRARTPPTPPAREGGRASGAPPGRWRWISGGSPSAPTPQSPTKRRRRRQLP